MFVEENRRWAFADTLLRRCKGLKVWMNDNLTSVGANMAVLVDRSKVVSAAPHLWGDVVLVVPSSQLTALGVHPDQLRLVGEMDKDDKVPFFEPEDDAEEEAKRAECVANGWDASKLDSTGQIWRRPM
jgi:hypothetical protein